MFTTCLDAHNLIKHLIYCSGSFWFGFIEEQLVLPQTVDQYPLSIVYLIHMPSRSSWGSLETVIISWGELFKMEAGQK